jgi:hypothetical protein
MSSGKKAKVCGNPGIFNTGTAYAANDVNTIHLRTITTLRTCHFSDKMTCYFYVLKKLLCKAIVPTLKR